MSNPVSKKHELWRELDVTLGIVLLCAFGIVLLCALVGVAIWLRAGLTAKAGEIEITLEAGKPPAGRIAELYWVKDKATRQIDDVNGKKKLSETIMWARCDEDSVVISGSCILSTPYSGGDGTYKLQNAGVLPAVNGWHCAWTTMHGEGRLLFDDEGDHRGDAAALCARLSK